MSLNAGSKMILADGRWSGNHGIGRFSHEILKRLKGIDVLQGPSPLSPANFIWQPLRFHQLRKNYRVYFTPGFNPILSAPFPYALTLHDLIHLEFPGKNAALKKLYYEKIIKPAVQKAALIFTVSNYSKQTICDWAGIAEEKIKVVYNGVSENFKVMGEKYSPGFHYILYVGNTKSHKNLARILTAFSLAKIDPSIKFVLTGRADNAIDKLAEQLGVTSRIVWTGMLSEDTLAKLYRGALFLAFPSLYEGFGLPVIEAMASGIPVLTSNSTSLPEIASDAALLVNPLSVDEMTQGMELLVADTSLRDKFIAKGLQHVKKFSWETSANLIQHELNQF